MPFSPITAQNMQYIQSGEGRYMLSSVTFGAPLNFFRVSGGTFNPKTGAVNAAISRVFEKNVTVAGATSRKACTIQLLLQATRDFSSADIDYVIADMNEFITPAVLDRILNGES